MYARVFTNSERMSLSPFLSKALMHLFIHAFIHLFLHTFLVFYSHLLRPLQIRIVYRKVEINILFYDLFFIAVKLLHSMFELL